MNKSIKLIKLSRYQKRNSIRYLTTVQTTDDTAAEKKEVKTIGLATKNYQSKLNNLIDLYNKTKSYCYTDTNYKSLTNPHGVFANNELDLNEIEIYGFDYDYTLAYYNRNLFQLIFNLTRNLLITNYKYPKELNDLRYIPNFPIRGLHFDKRNGWLVKIDSYHNIQLGTVYLGMRAVNDKTVKSFYNGIHISIEDIGYTQTSLTMHQFIDLFCLPEICLISSIIEYFQQKNIQFSPDYIFEDVRDAISTLHKSELLHRTITQSIRDYIYPVDQANVSLEMVKLKELLLRLRRSNKNTFLITNSKFWFVNLGMTCLLGTDWTNLFDIIICNARKPNFFTSKTKPFRKNYNDATLKSWDRVTKFEKDGVYNEGNLFDLLRFTGWHNKKVLYFGDNLYSDLAEPFLKHGWRTGGIIKELNLEINIINSIDYQRAVTWLVTLENLLQQLMLLTANNAATEVGVINPSVDTVSEELLLKKKSIEQEWFRERDLLRAHSKSLFNPYFGSAFRTFNNPTFFSRRLSRFADIYTSNITNLLDYPVNYHFIPRRIDLAHENVSNLNITNIT